MKKVVIIGGGTAGISIAARLKNTNRNFDIVIIEPELKHYYQPLWTLVGAGITYKEDTEREMQSVIPKNVKWIRDHVIEFYPEENKIRLKLSNETESYDYLIVCPGIQIDWNKVEGLEETIGKNGVCSNYSYKTVESTWEFLQKTKEGRAIFTFPNTPIKCGGAPQKIMYLAEEYFREKGLRNKIEVEFASAGEKIFGVEKYRNSLEKIIKDRDIKTHFQINLEKIDGENKIAYFRDLKTNDLIEKSFSMIHVTPPMSAPDFIKNSPLRNAEGWVDIDPNSLRHKKYSNIFSLGDASSAPTAKTGAAIRKQAPVLIQNLLSHIDGKELLAKYNGYSSCPLVTGKGKLILAEFDYDGKPAETFPFDQSKERKSMYWLKKYLLPPIYWYGMLKGRI